MRVENEHLDGEPVWKLTATPKPGLKGATEEERAALSTVQTWWIDRADYAFLKDESKWVAPLNGFLPGSSWVTTDEKVFVMVHLASETRFLAYRKFEVESSVEF